MPAVGYPTAYVDVYTDDPGPAHPTTLLLFDALGRALTRDAEGHDNRLLIRWLEGPGHLLGRIDDVVRDGGWTDILDPTASPPEWLGWVAQFAGVRLTRGLTTVEQRQTIVATAGQQRGTRTAIRDAARSLLTGDRRVSIDERTDGDGNADAYQLRVTTFASETPGDGSAVEQAILQQKPAGLVLHYRVLAESSYADLTAAFASYADVSSFVP